ncbi:uncharacterized protein METZ01_LOCUS514473, partial [marine metagenome]
ANLSAMLRCEDPPNCINPEYVQNRQIFTSK